MWNVWSGLRRNECPRCGSGYLVRSHRKGWEQWISALGVFPYRCDACGERFPLFGAHRSRPMEDDSRSTRRGKQL
jgi:DNA-directed RNA polymerase subunit RPC12/RpoP